MYIFFKGLRSLIRMVQRTRLLECPSCQKQLEDTKQESITCKFCGNSFRRIDVVQDDEDYIRRKMIVDLRTDMEIYKARKKFSTILILVFVSRVFPKGTSPTPIGPAYSWISQDVTPSRFAVSS